mmetsp:Transcript_10913/g.27526  ORF Transcript_10913/g.27526 Transcript_10913/m.27526 type:complete len:305 (+) Transcript_10913:506-1420(+)
MHVVLAWEQGLPPQKLRKDAANRPNVDGCCVLGAAQQQLGRPVPPRHHVLRHVLLFAVGPGETKVADFQVTVRVQEQVGWLEISVEHVRRVDVLEAPEQLVDEVLAVLVAERLRGANDLVQVRVHELIKDVHVFEDLPVGRWQDIPNLDDVFVLEVPQELNLAEHALGVDDVLEGVADLLDGEALARERVARRAHHAVRALPDGLDGLVLGVHLEELPAHQEVVVPLAPLALVADLRHRLLVLVRGTLLHRHVLRGRSTVHLSLSLSLSARPFSVSTKRSWRSERAPCPPRSTPPVCVCVAGRR